MNGFRSSSDRKWSNFGRSDSTKPNGDDRNRQVYTTLVPLMGVNVIFRPHGSDVSPCPCPCP